MTDGVVGVVPSFILGSTALIHADKLEEEVGESGKVKNLSLVRNHEGDV